MKKLDFIRACNAVCVDPGIALENENIVMALKQKNDAVVLHILKNEF